MEANAYTGSHCLSFHPNWVQWMHGLSTPAPSKSITPTLVFPDNDIHFPSAEFQDFAKISAQHFLVKILTV